MAGRYPEVSSKLCRGPTTVVIWKLDGWGITKEQDPLGQLFSLLCENASCYINVDSGLRGPDGVPVAEAPKARLRFHFGDNWIPEEQGDLLDVSYLDLKVEELFNLNKGILRYEMKVEGVDEQLNPIDDYVKPVTLPHMAFHLADVGILTKVLQKKFIKVYEAYEGECLIPAHRVGEFDEHAMKYFPRPEVLRLKISVTPIFVHNDSEGAGAGQGLEVKEKGQGRSPSISKGPASKSDPKPETMVSKDSDGVKIGKSSLQPPPGPHFKVTPGGSLGSGSDDFGADFEGGGDDAVDPQKSYPDANQLFVGNLPHFITQKDMIDIFSQFGQVAQVTIHKPMPKLTRGAAKVPKFGYVVFENPASVELAMRKKGDMFMELSGGGRRRLNVERKRAPKHAKVTGNGTGGDSQASQSRKGDPLPSTRVGNRPGGEATGTFPRSRQVVVSGLMGTMSDPSYGYSFHGMGEGLEEFNPFGLGIGRGRRGGQ